MSTTATEPTDAEVLKGVLPAKLDDLKRIALVQRHLMTDDELKRKKQEVGQHQKMLTDTMRDLSVAREELAQLFEAIETAKADLAKVLAEIAPAKKQMDAYRVQQIAVIESAGKSVDVESRKVA